MSEFNKTFTSLSFFVESPEYFEGGVFHNEMNDEVYNKQTFIRLNPQLKRLQSFKGYQVFELDHPIYGPENKTYYLVANEEIIEGAIEIETKKLNNFCLGVWQRNVPTNKGLMRNFFVQYLPKLYKNIVSGKIANELGMKFWKKLLEYFVNNKLKVTIFSGVHKQEQNYEPLKFEEYWTHVKQDKKTNPTFIDGSNKLFKFYLA
jgi:hypothetical protein